MENLKKHEQFEMEVLKKLSDARQLNRVVFGGGTCLRLCFGLPRYSIDLDFWCLPEFERKDFNGIRKALAAYEVTDIASKHYSYLLELRSPAYPNRLKLEIRKEPGKPFETERNIAYSFQSAFQVQLITLTLAQMWQNKISALMDRKEVRDAYDLEYLYKKGAAANHPLQAKAKKAILKILESFTKQDLKVKLGSLLPADERDYYAEKGFALLINALR